MNNKIYYLSFHGQYLSTAKCWEDNLPNYIDEDDFNDRLHDSHLINLEKSPSDAHGLISLDRDGALDLINKLQKLLDK